MLQGAGYGWSTTKVDPARRELRSELRIWTKPISLLCTWGNPALQASAANLAGRRSCVQDADATAIKISVAHYAASTVLAAICSCPCPRQHNDMRTTDRAHEGALKRKGLFGSGNSLHRQRENLSCSTTVTTLLFAAVCMWSRFTMVHAPSAKRAQPGAEDLGFLMLPPSRFRRLAPATLPCLSYDFTEASRVTFQQNGDGSQVHTPVAAPRRLSVHLHNAHTICSCRCSCQITNSQSQELSAMAGRSCGCNSYNSRARFKYMTHFILPGAYRLFPCQPHCRQLATSARDVVLHWPPVSAC